MKYIVLLILSIPVIFFSRHTFLKVNAHGFYRFFSWMSIVWLFSNNYSYWFKNPLSVQQLFSWFFLLLSIYCVLAGMLLLKNAKSKELDREDDNLYAFEKTTNLIDYGIYKYIRHPLYASLLYLTWGIFLKNCTIHLFIISLLSSLMLLLTAVSEEKECTVFFGDSYKAYMKSSKRFIPFIF